MRHALLAALLIEPRIYFRALPDFHVALGLDALPLLLLGASLAADPVDTNVQHPYLHHD